MKYQGRLGAVRTTFVAATLLVAACGGTTTDTGSASKEPVEIGVAAGITGYLAANDGPVADGIKFAADRVNRQGGVDGHKLNVHVVDMASSASTGVTVVNQLLNQYNVGVIMTGSSSAGTAAEAPIVGPRKVPMIVNTVLPSDPTWVFSVLPLVDHIVQAEMGFAAKDLKATKVALFYSQTPYGQQASKIVADTAKSSYGLNVVLNIGVDANSTDVSPLLARARDAKADALITVLTGPLQIVLAKNASSLGLTLPILLSIDDPSVIKQAAASYGPLYLNVSAPMAWPDQISDPKRKAAVKDFMTEWKAAGHSDLTGGIFALYGWDEVQLLVSAIKASHATTGDALRNALEKATLTGTTTDYIYSASDHTGQQKVPIPVAIGQYKAGNLVIVSPFPK